MEDARPQIQEAGPTPTEYKLITLWQTLLDIPSVNATDDFLDLGGDSLAAMRCISRIRQMFQVEISLDEFFIGQATVSHFASLIDDLSSGAVMIAD